MPRLTLLLTRHSGQTSVDEFEFDLGAKEYARQAVVIGRSGGFESVQRVGRTGGFLLNFHFVRPDQ